MEHILDAKQIQDLETITKDSKFNDATLININPKTLMHREIRKLHTYSKFRIRYECCG